MYTKYRSSHLLSVSFCCLTAEHWMETYSHDSPHLTWDQMNNRLSLCTTGSSTCLSPHHRLYYWAPVWTVQNPSLATQQDSVCHVHCLQLKWLYTKQHLVEQMHLMPVWCFKKLESCWDCEWTRHLKVNRGALVFRYCHTSPPSSQISFTQQGGNVTAPVWAVYKYWALTVTSVHVSMGPMLQFVVWYCDIVLKD